MWKNLTLLLENNKGADQSARPCSLISAFVICYLKSKLTLNSPKVFGGPQHDKTSSYAPGRSKSKPIYCLKKNDFYRSVEAQIWISILAFHLRIQRRGGAWPSWKITNAIDFHRPILVRTPQPLLEKKLDPPLLKKVADQKPPPLENKKYVL